MTGAAGFVGSAVVRTLVGSGAAVTAVVRPGSDLARLASVTDRIGLERADLLDVEGLARSVRSAAPDFVVHAAIAGGHGESPERARALLETGLLGTHNLVRALDGVPIRRLVHAGSSLEYGPRSRPLREDDEPRPSTLRGVAKASATLLLQQQALRSGLPAVTLRIFSVYGPWENPDRFVPTAVRAAAERVPLRLTRRGIRRDFVHLEDVAAAFLAALTADLHTAAIVNVGTGVETANEAVVALLEDVSGQKIDVREGEYPLRPVDVEHWVADISLAQRVLGWTPARSIRDGLAETFRWWQARLSRGSGAG